MKTFRNKAIAYLVIPVFVMSLALPAQTFAAYQPQDKEDLLAYLYGQLAILQAILADKLDDDDYVSEPRSSRDSSRDAEIDLETLNARNIESDEAELRLEIDFDDSRRATVWFEYGEDRDDLDERTTKYSLTKSSHDGDTIEIRVRNLEEDQRYYYQAVGEDDDGERVYGDIRSFTTDDDGSSRSSSGDFEISVDDYSIDAGDRIRVEWEVPRGDESGYNWIGVFREDDNNYQYISWTYLDNDDRGTEYFTINYEGDYEVRLFLNNSYDDEVTSRRIVVD